MLYILFSFVQETVLDLLALVPNLETTRFIAVTANMLAQTHSLFAMT